MNPNDLDDEALTELGAQILVAGLNNPDLQQANDDVIEVLGGQFRNRWEDERFFVDASIINFAMLWTMVRKRYPEEMDAWTDKLVLPEEAQLILGELYEVFVDYVNYYRHTLILQWINTWTAISCLELVFDEKGNDFYIVSETINVSEPVVNLLNNIIIAYQNYKD